MYKYFNIGKTIEIICNNNQCIYKLYYSPSTENEKNQYVEHLECNILYKKKSNDEL